MNRAGGLGAALGLAVLLAVSLGALALGGALTRPAIPEWYASLAKPDWTPPDRVFTPVWTALFVMMAVAAWLVWRRAGAAARRPLALFAVQLGLNVLWSALFFAARSPGLALLDIGALLIAIAATIAAFRRVSRAAAWLLVPYLLWVGYAAALNLAIWRLN